jgi:cobalamin-dependent methionine synthase-like protein
MKTFSVPHLDLKTHAIAKKLRTDVAMIERLVESFNKATNIKAAFKICYLDEKGEDSVTIEGVKFVSRVLVHNLSKAGGKLFPFVLTLGKRVDALIDGASDILEKYLLDEIGNIALRESRQQLERHLSKNFAFDSLSCMAPGSLEDWPIVEQKKLFSLFNDFESTISVHLTNSCLMIPRKSVSGIYFPSEVTFHSCQLCPRERCESRKASFDESKAREYGI